MSAPLLSICIPTNGIIELIFPVLESIYSQQNIDTSIFEVIVVDNGDNKEFKTRIKEYSKTHKNLIYKETELKGFLNESECYKQASGAFIKFINHRTKLLPNTINYLIDFIKKNKAEKPCVYFSNGVIKGIKGKAEYADFDSYVRNLQIWSSWSTGMGFWKEDFNRLPKDIEFNELFPHTTILFAEQNKKKYIIDNTVLLNEINVGHANKGKYNLFYAFGIEYPCIIFNLYHNKSISIETFLKIKKANLKFIASLYMQFVLQKQKCSYDLSRYKQSLEVFYGYKKVKLLAFRLLCEEVVKYPARTVKDLMCSIYCSIIRKCKR